ncbi:HNH endonuclease [Gracilimonas sp.]|uniref:HNH endonuclease n=1 Tax=Gracilimonas sp. TaxID=1974203 RepID=UPI0032EC0041
MFLQKLPFIPGQSYKRSIIHDEYGGSRQGGISPCANYPFIFIFTGSKGEKHGYRDQWENQNVFSYTGEGQVGDMEFARGNLALKEHIKNGKRVFLFEYIKTGYVRFETELELFDFDFFTTPDREGNLREGIKFFFKKAGVNLNITTNDLKYTASSEPSFVSDLDNTKTTERSGLVTSRVGQGAYRKSILHRWEYQCAVTKFDDTRVLIASHIVAWKDSNDEERLDVDNGILLSPTYDALFDRHLITFDEQGKIVLSNQIMKDSFLKIGVSGSEKLQRLHQGNKTYLRKHQEEFVSTQH